MVILEKKQRSTELNTLKRILVDFKSLVNDNQFLIYKTSGLIYYIFDKNGFFIVRKESSFLAVENFLEENEFIAINYSQWKQLVELKKSEVTEICYDTEKYKIQTAISDDLAMEYVWTKELDEDGKLKAIIDITSDEQLEGNFIEATFNSEEQMLYSIEGDNIYPYKITFSDDINFQIKNNEDAETRYYVKPLNSGSFIQVITKSVYKNIFIAQSMLFVFNYLNNRGE